MNARSPLFLLLALPSVACLAATDDDEGAASNEVAVVAESAAEGEPAYVDDEASLIAGGDEEEEATLVAPTGPSNLRGFAGGRDIALTWKGFTGATKYRVYRDGKLIGTAPLRPKGNRFSNTAGFVDNKVVLGTTYAYAVEAELPGGKVSTRTPQVSVTHASKGTPIPKIALDATAAPELKGYLEKGKTFLETWYPKIGDLLFSPDFIPMESFKIKIDKAPCGAGLAYLKEKTIGLCVNFAKKHPYDLSIFAHEATHLMQSYSGPTMIVEGVASWGGDIALGLVQSKPSRDATYFEGYGSSEYFFDWIAAKYKKPAFARDLNLAAKAGTYDPSFFAKQTGKTLGQLWSEMSGRRISSPGRLTEPGGKCADLDYLKTQDGTPIKLQPCHTSGYLTRAQEVSAFVSANDASSFSIILANKCLAPNAAGRLVLMTCKPADTAQRWKNANGALQNVGRNRCLQPEGGRTENGTALVLAACNGAAIQKLKWPAPGT